MDRRRFLARLGLAAAAGSAIGALPPWTRGLIAAPGAPADLIERCDWPEQWETSLAALGRDFMTPVERFFVRSHFGAPEVDPAAWRLEIAGKVAHPVTLALAELRAMPQTSNMVTLECAGNGRALYPLASTSGTQWAYGAVGNARWSGVSLAKLLRQASPASEAKHVWFECADHATLDSAPRFLRSIPIEKAMGDTLLALDMDDAPLTRLHGAPLRAIVPGWYGMASAKWVTRIRLEAEPSDNHFMAKGYRYVYPGEDPATAAPVEAMRVKSIITRPLDGARIPRGGTLPIEGFAWSGAGRVARVEVSFDDGATWHDTAPTSPRYPSAWLGWDAQLAISKPGPMSVIARATDETGGTQPLAALPNASGYANNSIHRVRFDVA